MQISSPDRTGPAARDLVAGYLNEQGRTIVALGRQLGAAGPGDDTGELVHDVRVAIRRLRSTLRTFSPALAEPAVTELAREASWYAGVLGAVRDLDVAGATVRSEVARLLDGPDRHLVVGDVQAWLVEALAEDRGRAWSDLQQTLASDRYARLRGELTRWAERPDWSGPADNPELTHRVKQARKQFRHRLERARSRHADPAVGRDEVLHQFHRARKAGKRYRYAVELAGPAWPDPDRTLAELKTLQDRLGALQDSVVLQQVLLVLGTRIGRRSGRNGFTFGVLTARAEIAQDLSMDALATSV